MEERIITSQECISEGLAALGKLEPKFKEAAKTIEEMSSLNHFCRFVDEAAEKWLITSTG